MSPLVGGGQIRGGYEVFNLQKTTFLCDLESYHNFQNYIFVTLTDFVRE